MWTVVDRGGKFFSKMSFASLADAIKYKKVLQERYPQYEMVIMLKGERHNDD